MLPLLLAVAQAQPALFLWKDGATLWDGVGLTWVNQTLADSVIAPDGFGLIGNPVGITVTGDQSVGLLTAAGGTSFSGSGRLIIGTGLVARTFNSGTNLPVTFNCAIQAPGDLSLTSEMPFSSPLILQKPTNIAGALQLTQGATELNSGAQLSCGTLVFPNSGPLVQLTVSGVGTTLSLSDSIGGTGVANVLLRGGRLRFTGPVGFSAGTVMVTGNQPEDLYSVIDTNGQDATMSGQITGHKWEKVGAGTLKLTNLANNWGLATTLRNSNIINTRVSGGLLEFGSMSHLALGGSQGSARLLQLDGGGLRWAPGTNVDPSPYLWVAAGGATFDTNGNNVTLNDNVGFGGVFPRSIAAAPLTKIGAGILNIQTSSQRTGPTVVRGGLIGLGTPTAAGASGPITMDGGGFRWNGHGTDISGRFQPLGPGGAVFDTNGNNVNVGGGTLSGPGSVRKIGLGTLNVVGTNPFTGSVFAEGGTLALSGILANKAGIRVGGVPSATLSLSRGGSLLTTPGNAVIGGSSGSVGVANITGGGTVMGLGTYLEVGSSGNGTLNVSGGAGVTSASTVAVGLLPGSQGTATITGTGSYLTAGTTLFVGYLSTGICAVASGGAVTAGTLNLGLEPGSSGTFVLDPGGTLNIGGANGITRGSGSASFAFAGGTLRVTGGNLTTSVPLTLSGASAVNTNGLNATLSGTLSGAGGLIKSGNGTLTLNAPSSYAGGTTITGGQVVVPAADRLGTGGIALNGGSLASSASFSRDSSVVVISPASALSAATYLEFGTSGTASLAVAGGGQVNAPASIAFGVSATAQASADVSGAGSVLSTGGTLYVGFLGLGGVTVGSGGNVTVGTQLLLAAQASGSGSFNLNSGGTLNLGGPDGLARGAGAAAFNLNGGTLRVTGVGLSTSVPMTLAGSCIVDTNGLGATLSGALTGSGDLTKTGAGVLAITSANTLTGSTGILAGTLGIATPTSLGTQTLFLNGGTLDLSFSGTANVQSLQFDNVPQASGIWGGLASTAPNKTARITGPGLLNVLTSVPPPSFNPATTAGLSYAINHGVVSLATLTGATPPGGTFSGPGVSGGNFDPSAAGYGLHTLTYTSGALSSTFTIAVTGGLTLDETGGAFAANNLAPGGTAFAKEVFLGYGSYTIPHLNDGNYGNSFSWIGTTANTYAGVRFASAVAVSRIAFGRDNTGAFTDRAQDFYLVQYSTAADPSQPSATWITLGAVDYRANSGGGIVSPSLRHVFSFPAVTATGLRIVCATPGAAIDEIEIYPATGLFATTGLTLLQEGGTIAPDNLATAGTAFAKDVFPHPSHTLAHLNDGTYGNSFSWLGTSANSFVGLNLGGSVTFDRVAFGRDNTGLQADRTLGRYTLQYTTVAAPDVATPDASWITLGLLDYQSASGSRFAAPSRRHLFGFPAVTATGIRLIAPTGAIIDELELYLAAPYLKLQQPDSSVVANSGTVDFGARFPAEATQKTFTITNSGTSTLALGALGLEGTTEGDFTASAIGVGTLEPGASTTFIIAFNVGAAGPHTATVLLPSNGATGSVASFTVTGTSLVPTVNAATTSGLYFDITHGLVNLATTTEASPAGGTFSGPGVTGNNFDPITAGYGIHTISYSYAGASVSFTLSVTGGLTLVAEGGSFAPNNLAPGGTAFAKEVFQGFGFYTIPHLNDGLYGEPNSWIGTTSNTFAGINLGATPVAVNRIAFGRDNQGLLTDRAIDFYLIQYTTAPNPDATTTAWTTIGALDYSNPAIANPALRHLFSFPTVNATGLRIVCATAGTAIDEIELYSPNTPLELWRQQYFGSTANTGNAADLADPDGDGVVNLLEYAFGLNPTQSASRQLPAVITDAGTLGYDFTGIAGVTYGAEWSTNLATWTPLADAGTGLRHIFSVATTGQSKIFVRLRVTVP